MGVMNGVLPSEMREQLPFIMCWTWGNYELVLLIHHKPEKWMYRHYYINLEIG